MSRRALERCWAPSMRMRRWLRSLTSDRRPAQSAIVERVLLWAFIAGLAWCPFWFGSNGLLAWGINAVLFPGLVAMYEVSLLIRGERHPVAIRQIKASGALFAAVVLWILIQNATWTPEWLHHPIWPMSADALDKPVDGSISVNRELTSLALLETHHSRKRLLDCLAALPRSIAGERCSFGPSPQIGGLRLCYLRSFGASGCSLGAFFGFESPISRIWRRHFDFH